MSNIVTFSLSNPSPALISEIMDAISRHGMDVPAGLARVPNQRVRPVRQQQPPPQQRQAPRQRVDPPVRAERAAPPQRVVQPPRGLAVREAPAGDVVVPLEHQEYYRSLPGFARSYGCTKYNPLNPYTITGFRLTDPADELVEVDPTALRSSFKQRLASLGFPTCNIESVVVAHEYPDHYFVVLFPGAPYEMPVNCPKDRVRSPKDAKDIALAGCLHDINRITDVRGILPYNYLRLKNLGTPPPLELAPLDEQVEGGDE
uniref:P2 protein n=1 Tax=Passion fruit green spot virus TaxID=989895 RepID=A0A5P9KF09_9VIRU|nr:P2 protein [Passion fruit green spot virus]